MRNESGKDSMSSTIILRLLQQTFQTNHSLNQFTSFNDVASMEWYGDGAVMRIYMQQMEALFEEMEFWTDERKRDLVYGHMKTLRMSCYSLTLLRFYGQVTLFLWALSTASNICGMP